MTEVAKDAAIKLEATTEINETIEIRPALAIADHAKVNLNRPIGLASRLVLALGVTAVEAQAEIAATVAAAEIAAASPLDAMAIATVVETIRNPAIHHSLVDQLGLTHPSR
jgi:hypothetical protein